MNKAILFVHGKGGNYQEAKQYEKNCEGFDIIGLDYEVDVPWNVTGKIKEAYEKLRETYVQVYLIANSIGAFFSMLALEEKKIEKALLISPIVDMEKLITDMINWANVTEAELEEKKEIPTDFGETLSWEYLTFVRKHPIKWNVPTEILYANGDNLTSKETVTKFVKEHQANVTMMEHGEHWFHTKEQMAFLDAWMKRVI